MIKNDILDTTELNISTMNMLTALQTKLAIYNAKYDAGIISYNEYKENIKEIEEIFESIISIHLDNLRVKREEAMSDCLNFFRKENNDV